LLCANEKIAKRVDLDENDILLAPDTPDDPIVIWCYTTKFPKSFHLRDRDSQRSLIAINLRDLQLKDDFLRSFCALDFFVVIYLNFVLLHELTHWAGADKRLPEYVWNSFIEKLALHL